MHMEEDWRKPGRSFANGNCVEVASGVRVRDSKDRQGPPLIFDVAAWRLFTDRLRSAEGDHE